MCFVSYLLAQYVTVTLSELAVRLSVPGNSVDAERSVSQYTLVNAPQRQNFTDENLALHVMMVVNARS